MGAGFTGMFMETAGPVSSWYKAHEYCIQSNPSILTDESSVNLSYLHSTEKEIRAQRHLLHVIQLVNGRVGSLGLIMILYSTSGAIHKRPVLSGTAWNLGE